MALKKTYYCWQKHYDYFGGASKDYTVELGTTPTEAIHRHREEKSYDYNYGDSFTTTYEIKVRYKYVSEHQRFHARSKYEWDKICKKKSNEEHLGFSEEEVKFLTSLFDVDDDDIII